MIAVCIVGIEEDHAGHVGAALELLAQQRRGTVAAAIVDEDHFVAQAQRIE
jgi:hypothetical protein